jgi:membrane fusion protein, multidrug efflux system
MKSHYYTRLVVAAVTAAFLASCSATSSDDKAAQLEKLKKQQTDINKQILDLEAQVGPDSTKTVRMKDVSVTALAPRKFDYFVQTQGFVDAEDNILVSARSAGVIKAVFVKEGQRVTKGQTLAQIDNSVMVQNLEGMKAQLELAKTIFERQKNLWDQKIGTEVQYLQAKTNKEALEKQLSSAQEQNDMNRITSPINGTVDQVTAKIGENIAPGMPAVRVVNTSDLKIKAAVSEAFVTNIAKGNKVVVTIPELKRDIQAQVTFVATNIDQLSRTFAVEAKLPSLPELRPNMTGVIKVIFHTEPNTLVVPVNVVQELNKEKVVFIAETDGKQTVARRKVVTVEAVYDNLAQVKGLAAGDKVITFGYQGLNDGQAIKI